MEKRFVEIPVATIENGVIAVPLTGDVSDWPIAIYWDGVRYATDILGDAVIRNGNTLILPGKMEGDRISVEYWVLTPGETRQNGAVISGNSANGSCKNIRFIVNNAIPTAKLSANHQLPQEMGVDNIKTEWRSRIMRDSLISEPLIISGAIDEDQDVFRMFSGFALAGYNLTPNSSVVLRLFDKIGSEKYLKYESDEINFSYIKAQGDFVWGIDPWGVAISDNINASGAYFFTETAANFFEIEISDPFNTDRRIDIRQIFLGDALTLDQNFSYGATLQWQSGQEHRRTEGGSLLTIGNSQVWRSMGFPFEFMTNNDRQRLTRQMRMRPGKTVFVSAYPAGDEIDQREFSMAAKFNTPTFRHVSVGDWSTQLDLIEV